ncbi:MAG: hypothetical protein JWO69_1838 [Thermoleophilia bacterium]|nr:hypothetical protein [Thermoleophilia bacterium]
MVKVTDARDSQNDHVEPISARAPVPWVRVAAFGVVTAGIGVVGHGVAADSGADLRLLVLAGLIGTLLARLAGRRRQHLPELMIALAVLQTVLHEVATSLARADGGAAHASHAGASGSTPSMFLVHVIAISGGALVLLALEAQAWALLALGVERVRRVARRFRPALRSERHGAAVSARPVRRATWQATHLQLHPASGVRGPPRAVHLPTAT